MESKKRKQYEKPVDGQLSPNSSDTSLPIAYNLRSSLKRGHHGIRSSDTQESRLNAVKKPLLDLKTPMQKAEEFFSEHKDCKECSNDCILLYQKNLEYSEPERKEIELKTRGQNKTDIWFEMRRGLLTASKYKKIIHSESLYPPENILKDPRRISSPRVSRERTPTPEPLLYGSYNENTALNKFFEDHRESHKKDTECKLHEQLGLYISSTNCYLGASPDGLIKCGECGDILIEVKCSYKHKSLEPEEALIKSKMCDKIDGEFQLKKDHKHYYQIQGTMFCTGVHSCVLVLFTDDGIKAVKVPYNKEFCEENEAKLSKYYNETVYPKLKEQFSPA